MTTQPLAAVSTTRAPRHFEFRGVVRFTRTGTTYLVFTILLGFAALNTGNNALYIGLTFLLGLLILSGLASKEGLRHLRLAYVSFGEIWAGEPVRGTLRIENGSRIWTVRDVLITAPSLSRPALLPIIRRKGSRDIEVEFLFQARGAVRLTSLDLYTRYPFGFFLKKRRVPLVSDVIVFPRRIETQVDDLREQATAGEREDLLRPGAGNEVHSFRDYQRGDSLRQIYWRKSAGLNRWIVKQTEEDATRAITIVVDTHLPGGFSAVSFEQMISEATGFLYRSVEQGLDVELFIDGSKFTVREREGREAMLTALALAQSSPVERELYEDVEAIVFSVRRR